jgi:ATP-dependent Lon protease
VLPIGGLKEKVLGAVRAGITHIVIPRENEPDLDDLPAETRASMTFIPADTIEDVFAAAFDGKRRARPRAAQSVERQAAMPAQSS